MSAARILVLLILAAGASLAAPGVNAWKERSAGFELAPKAAARLERRLESGKGDAGDRIRLLAWYSKQIESEQAVAIREKRIPLILWLVEHADAHIPLHSSICVADMHPAGDPYADEAGYRLVKNAWLAKVEQSPENLAITAQASSTILSIFFIRNIYLAGYFINYIAIKILVCLKTFSHYHLLIGRESNKLV